MQFTIDVEMENTGYKEYLVLNCRCREETPCMLRIPSIQEVLVMQSITHFTHMQVASYITDH